MSLYEWPVCLSSHEGQNENGMIADKAYIGLRYNLVGSSDGG